MMTSNLAENLDYGLLHLLELHRQNNMPTQQASLDTAIEAWGKALWDIKRSQHLTQLNMR